MNTRPGRRRRPVQANFVPQLEQLENRELLSCSISVRAGTLTVRGDSGPNQVAITDDGTGGAGNITVECDGQSRTFDHIHRLVVKTNAGPDSLHYDLAGDLNDARTVKILLGDGDDEFLLDFSDSGSGWGSARINRNLNISLSTGSGNDGLSSGEFDLGDVGPARVTLNASLDDGDDRLGMFADGDLFLGARLTIKADGKDGDDLINVDGTNTSSDRSMHIAAGALASVTLRGSAGDDSISGLYGGELNGRIRLLEDGGDGDDNLLASATISGDDFDPRGRADAVLRGGNGDDTLTDEAIDESDGAAVGTASVDGGRGTDDCSAPDGAVLRNCEDSESPTRLDGTWAGTTAQGKDFSFTVESGRVTSLSFGYRASGVGCSITSDRTDTGISLPVVNGRFSFTDDDPDGSTVTIEGVFSSGRGASGTLEIFDSFCLASLNTTWTVRRA